MKISLSLFVVALLSPFASFAEGQHGVSAQKQVLHPHMTRLLEERGPSKGWVFFRDKGPSGNLAESLRRARTELGARALERRRLRRTRPGIVDAHDVPVHRDYVEAVVDVGVELVVESSWLNAISVRGTLEQFRALAELPFVARVEPVRRGVLLEAASAAEARSPRAPGKERGAQGFYGLSGPQLAQLNLIAAHQGGFTGSGVVIGVLDTGFHRGHEAFQFPGHEIDVLAEYDFLDDDPFTGIEMGDPSAQHNHGTMVLGTLAAFLPGELIGGAYDASYVLVKTEDTTAEYRQEEDFYVAGLQFIEANGADVATSSLGYIDWYTQSDLDGLTAVTTIAVNIASGNGLLCCTAAGNDHHDGNPTTSSLIAPSDAFDVITCGAVELDGQMADFSSDGPSADGRVKPEVVALGRLVMTNCAHADVDCTTDTGGTSFATPLIASALACILQARPNWTIQKVRERLFETGDYFVANGTHDPTFVRGYGIPDALRALLDDAGEPNPSGPPGTATKQF